MGEERALLGHVAEPAPLGRFVAVTVVHRVAADADLTLLDPVETGDQAQQRRLAAAGRPQDRGERVGPDRQVDADQHGLIAVALVDAGQLEVAHDRPTVATGSLVAMVAMVWVRRSNHTVSR